MSLLALYSTYKMYYVNYLLWETVGNQSSEDTYFHVKVVVASLCELCLNYRMTIAVLYFVAGDMRATERKDLQVLSPSLVVLAMVALTFPQTAPQRQSVPRRTVTVASRPQTW